MPGRAGNQFKRRNYFIDKRFQSNFIIKFILIFLLGGLAAGCIIYFLALQSTTVAFLNSRGVARTTADFILPILIQTAVFVVIGGGVAAVLLTLLVSHRISGPLYRFEKVMEALEKGDFTSECYIRRRDQFQGLADAINNMIAKTRTELALLKKGLSSLVVKGSDVSEGDLPEDKRQALKEIKSILRDINKPIEHFKV